MFRENLAYRLSSNSIIKMVERANIETLIKEQEFSISDYADPEKTLQFGKMLSAKYLIFGSLIELSSHNELNLKLTNVETGEVIITFSEKLHLENKSNRIAVAGSTLLGGVGQIYKGHRSRGLVFMTKILFQA